MKIHGYNIVTSNTIYVTFYLWLICLSEMTYAQDNNPVDLLSEKLVTPAVQDAYGDYPNSFTARWNCISNAKGYLLDVSDNPGFAKNYSGIVINENFSQVDLPNGWYGASTAGYSFAFSYPRCAWIQKGRYLMSPKVSYVTRINFYVRSNQSTEAMLIVSYKSNDDNLYSLDSFNVSPTYRNIELDLSGDGVVNISDLEDISIKLESKEDNIFIDDLKIYSDTNVLHTIYGFKDRIANDCYYPVTGLLECKTYYYRVRAFNENDTSEYSDTRPVYIHNSKIGIIANLDKPHRSCDIEIYIPIEFNRYTYQSNLEINEIKYSAKELIPADTFKCSIGNLKPDIVNNLEIMLYDEENLFIKETVKYKAAPAPLNEEKKILLIIDNELNNDTGLEKKFVEYENDIIKLYPDFKTERYYINDNFEEKRRLYSYIKEEYKASNLYYLFFIGDNASMQVYFELVNPDGNIGLYKKRENFSFYSQLHNSIYDYDTVQHKFYNRYANGYYDKPELYCRVVDNYGMDINYGVVVSPLPDIESQRSDLVHYFDKLHKFRYGGIKYDRSALYSNTMDSFGNQSIQNALYTSPRWKNNKGIYTTHEPSAGYHGHDPAWKANYLSAIENESFEICYLNVHGSVNQHYFDINYSDIANLKALNTALISLVSCNTACYTADHFIGGTYLMQGNVLAFEGFTEPVSIVSTDNRDARFDPGSKYYEISTGARFSDVLNSAMPIHVLFGDPLLGLNEYRMTIDSVTIAQENNNYVIPGAINQDIMQISIFSSGRLGPLQIDQFQFRNLCSDNNDILCAKLFFTADKCCFDTLHQIGASVTGLDSLFTFIDSVNLKNGINNFWLTYSLNKDSKNKDILDAELLSLTSKGLDYSPAIMSPDGNRVVYSKDQVDTLPWIETFENATGRTSYYHNQCNLYGIPWWSFNSNETNTCILELNPDSLWCYSGEKAAYLQLNKVKQCCELTAGINLTNYIHSKDLELSFFYKSGNTSDSIAKNVFIRGADSLMWLEATNPGQFNGEAGIWKHVSGIDIDSILCSNGQLPSSGFELRFSFGGQTCSSTEMALDDVMITGSPDVEIITHPISQNICENIDVNFRIETHNTDKVYYQWFKNENPLNKSNYRISGIDSSVLTIVKTELNDSGNYSCLISYKGQTLMSNSASLKVLSKPTASIQGDTVICEGSKARLTVYLSGEGPWVMTYKSQWDTTNILSDQNIFFILDSVENEYQIIHLVDINNCEGDDLGKSGRINVLKKPVAGFEYTINASLNVAFFNTSINATEYLWDFGDNHTESAPNPVHTYAAEGNYITSLIAYNDVCPSVPYAEQVNLVGTNVTGLLNPSKISVYPNPTTHILYIESQNDLIYELYDQTGRFILLSKDRQIDFSKFEQGIYYIRFMGAESISKFQKIVYCK